MTDAEIKKDLLFVAHYCHDEYNEIRVDVLLLYALDLINRQQAENKAFGEIMKKQDDEISELRKELLKKQNLEEIFSKERKQFDKKMLKQVKRERAEAIKEYKNKVKSNLQHIPQHHFTLLAVKECLDEVDKEMVGDAE